MGLLEELNGKCLKFLYNKLGLKYIYYDIYNGKIKNDNELQERLNGLLNNFEITTSYRNIGGEIYRNRNIHGEIISNVCSGDINKCISDSMENCNNIVKSGKRSRRRRYIRYCKSKFFDSCGNSGYYKDNKVIISKIKNNESDFSVIIEQLKKDVTSNITNFNNRINQINKTNKDKANFWITNLDNIKSKLESINNENKLENSINMNIKKFSDSYDIWGGILIAISIVIFIIVYFGMKLYTDVTDYSDRGVISRSGSGNSGRKTKINKKKIILLIVCIGLFATGIILLTLLKNNYLKKVNPNNYKKLSGDDINTLSIYLHKAIVYNNMIVYYEELKKR